MPTINLGVDYEDVKNLDDFPVVPGGTYPFTIRVAKDGTTNAGRPKIFWGLEVIDPASNKPTSIPHNTVLPWMKDGEMDVSGVGMLVQICKAVGLPWTGKSLDTEAYLGRSGTVTVKIERRNKQDPTGNWVPDPDGKEQNVVDKFIY